MAAKKKSTEKIDIEKLNTDLLNKWEESTRELKTNTSYYESEQRPEAIGIATPQEMRRLIAHVGYSRLYVNALAERLTLEGFRMPKATEADERLSSWWRQNQLDFESTLGHTEALIHGRAYITVSMPDPSIDIDWPPDIPIIRVESPTSLYAQVDPRTRTVKYAIRPTYNDAGDEVTYTTLYTPDQTIYFEKTSGQWEVVNQINHGLGAVPVVPLVNRSKVSDLLGTSEISPELRSSQDTASAMMMNMRTAAELLAVPTRLIFGATEDDFKADPADPSATFEAYMARIMAFEDPQAKAFQFAAAELRNFTDGLMEIHRQVSAYTGLPPQYLAQSSDNPASAEAIQSSESRLVKLAERKAQMFGNAWEQAMRIGMRMVDSGKVTPEAMQMSTVWRNPATPTYQAKADGVTKLYASGMGVIPLERARMDMGYNEQERLEMQQMDQESPLNQMAGMYAQPNKPSAKAEAEEPAPKEDAA